ncbi:MAG: gliding motility-associated ABC transporter permease subunit GldF [Bacteroidetes bacterium]|nr:gliding motility-associated ABC transporter permease subunit GldF [Bacteroidota bacterium]
MITVLRKEINLFFSSLVGYMAVAVFLAINSIFLWVLNDGSILGSGYATLDQFFIISPWVFMFLIPAITMRSFAEEFKTGTIEILATKPISDLQIVLGKFLAGWALIIIALLPSLVYFYSIYQLAAPVGNVDVGAILGSYIGLLLLGGAYLVIGLWASSLTDNQIVSFILAILFCFVFYALLDWIRAIETFAPFDEIIAFIGLQAHYNSVSQGVIDTRDVIYFLGFMLLFIFITKTKLASRKW